MQQLRKFSYLTLFLLLPFFSCKKVQEIITQNLSPEIKINQEFEFVFKEYAKQIAKQYGFDTTGINVDNLPSYIFSLPLPFTLDTVGIDSFEISQLDYVYKYALTDLDSNIQNNPGNVLSFSRANISSAKVDSARLYLLSSSPIKEQDFSRIVISATNNSIPSPVKLVDATSGFLFQSVSGEAYTNMMRLPVINPEQQYSQYMIPPNDSIQYIFKVVFKNPIKFALDDKYKLAFNYKFIFKK